MRTVADHQQAIRSLLEPLRSREAEPWPVILPPVTAVPRVLAADVRSPIDLPPFDNSQMDGYAVRSADVRPGEPLAVVGRIAAGSHGTFLDQGDAAPIMTGAPLPIGADAVIPIEDSTPDSFQPEDAGLEVAFAAPVTVGTFVRRRGSDIAAGSLLLSTGTALGPAQWGVLTASGVGQVSLLRRVRVLVLSTGDELVRAGTPLEHGQIYDANGTSMAVALAGAGAVVSDVVVVADRADEVRAVLDERAADIDLILTTGGVSQGAYEVVRDVFENPASGEGSVAFDTIAMQPGGPQGFGTVLVGQRIIPVVSFPGNPVSALVSFEMFLRPVLRELHGLAADRPRGIGPLDSATISPAGKHQVRRGRLKPNGSVELVGGASSHLLHGYAASTLLVHVPLGVASLERGDEVEYWRIDE